MQQKMSKKSSLIAQKMLDLLGALLLARKSDICHKLVKKMVLLARKSDIFHKLIKKVVHSTNESSRALLYGDHEFSFQNTPVVHVRMHRPPSALRFIRMPHIPCIKPQADRHDDDAMCRDHVHRTCFLNEEMSDSDDGEGIDKRAEEFIAKFYEDMKLQTQISCL